MVIGLLEVDVRLADSHSLKDKRQPLRSILERVRRSHNVSIAEVAHQDVWDRAGLAVVGVNTERAAMERTLDSILDEIEETPGIEFAQGQKQWL